MDHHPSVAIEMTAGGDVLKTEAATDVPVTVARRIGASQNVVLATPMERIVDRLLIAAPPIEDPRTDSFPTESPPSESLLTDSLLTDGLPIAVFQSVALKIQAPVTAALPSIAPLIVPPIVQAGIGR
jgi:hypothetical protein